MPVSGLLNNFVLMPAPGSHGWKQMASPEGGESLVCEIKSRRLFERAAMCHPLSSCTPSLALVIHLIF
jgi:hypothetical protein